MSTPHVGLSHAQARVLRRKVTLASADILALAATPFVLVPAPAANQIVVVDKIICEYVFNSVAYTGGGALSVAYGTTGVSAATAPDPTTPVNSANMVDLLPNATVVLTPSATIVGQAVQLSSTVTYAAGNGTWSFIVYYTLQT